MSDDFNGGELTAKLIHDLSVINLNFHVICDFFGIPKEKRYNPNCGAWIVSWIKDGQKQLSTRRPDEMFDTFFASPGKGPGDKPADDEKK